MALRSTDAAILAASLGGILILAATHATYAHKGATGIVMQRMMTMKSMGKSMKELALMVTGRKAFDADKAKAIAGELKQHADKMPKQFPKGSLKKPTEALPAIWEKWDDFKALATQLSVASGEFDAAADNGRASSLTAFVKIGKTCSGCHKDYRLTDGKGW